MSAAEISLLLLRVYRAVQNRDRVSLVSLSNDHTRNDRSSTDEDRLPHYQLKAVTD
jgi:hypothetical protein